MLLSNPGCGVLRRPRSYVPTGRSRPARPSPTLADNPQLAAGMPLLLEPKPRPAHPIEHGVDTHSARDQRWWSGPLRAGTKAACTASQAADPLMGMSRCSSRNGARPGRLHEPLEGGRGEVMEVLGKQ